MATRKAPPSDALVFFGATGDLAYKKIFPALQSMVIRRNLSMPIIGVASSKMSTEQLRNRARESVRAHAPETSDDDFARLADDRRGGGSQGLAGWQELDPSLKKSFDVALHLGTFFAVLGYFRHDVTRQPNERNRDVLYERPVRSAGGSQGDPAADEDDLDRKSVV